MQRLLYIVLALSILITQSAWAIHGDKIGTKNSEQTYTQTSPHGELTDCCSHFCHASAHLVGLFSDNIIELHVSRDSHIETLKNVIISSYDQPSIPPPIA